MAVGRVLGVEGSTGSSTGNHLHFEVIKDAVPVDPVPFMADHGAPLDGRTVAPNTHGDPMRPAGVESGIGFDLPTAGTPRLNSLSSPAAPIPPRVKALYVAAANTVPAAVDAARRDRDGRDRPRRGPPQPHPPALKA